VGWGRFVILVLMGGGLGRGGGEREEGWEGDVNLLKL